MRGSVLPAIYQSLARWLRTEGDVCGPAPLVLSYVPYKSERLDSNQRPRDPKSRALPPAPRSDNSRTHASGGTRTLTLSRAQAPQACVAAITPPTRCMSSSHFLTYVMSRGRRRDRTGYRSHTRRVHIRMCFTAVHLTAAGAQGIEPHSRVLETRAHPLYHTPIHVLYQSRMHDLNVRSPASEAGGHSGLAQSSYELRIAPLGFEPRAARVRAGSAANCAKGQ